MGIYSRDYIRDDQYERRIRSLDSNVCKPILIVTIVVFVAQLFTQQTKIIVIEGFEFATRTSLVAEWFSLNMDAVTSGQVWRFLTYAFCHDTDALFHILFNMLLFWWFGRELEQIYGSREFLYFYLMAAVFAGLCYLVLGILTQSIGNCIGASGAIMAIMMVYAIHYPTRVILIWGIIPVQIRWLVAIYVVFDAWPVLNALQGTGVSDGVAHSAHLGGLLFGFLYWKQKIRFEQLFKGLSLDGLKPNVRRGPKLKVHVPEEPESFHSSADQDAEVDRILQKISEQGEGSLTDEERQTMIDASNRYKNRTRT